MLFKNIHGGITSAPMFGQATVPAYFEADQGSKNTNGWCAGGGTPLNNPLIDFCALLSKRRLHF